MHATSDCTELSGAVLAGQSQVTSTFLGMAELTDAPAASRPADTPVTYLIGRGNNINSSYIIFEEITVSGPNVTEGTEVVLDNILQGTYTSTQLIESAPRIRADIQPCALD